MHRETIKAFFPIPFLSFRRNNKLHQRCFKKVIQQRNFMRNHCLGTIYFFCHEKNHQIIFGNTHKSLSIRSWIKPVSTEILEGATCLYPEWIFTDKETFLKPLSIQTKAQSTWNQEVSLARGFRSFRLDFLFSKRNCKKQHCPPPFLTYINVLDL